MSEEITFIVESPAQRLLVRGLSEVRDLLDRLEGSSILIGGLMAQLWLHARPIDLPMRPTADLDLGIDPRPLRLIGDRKLVEPMLRELDFDQAPGDDDFRFRKTIGGEPFVVDLLVPEGRSRYDPPLLERGLSSLAAPGLNYAHSRGAVVFNVAFVDGARTTKHKLWLPTLDAAFVLKGVLVARGVRQRRRRLIADTVDTICLAAACLRDGTAVEALRDARGTPAVADALRWATNAFERESSAASRRVQRHFEDEAGIETGAAWAVAVAGRLGAALAE